MHQPLTLAHIEGVRGVDGEIIHLLRLVDIPFQPDRASGAVGLADLVAHAQVFSLRPAPAFDACPEFIEG